jgi:multidrug efflux pump subunit AcrA (membrane-fusion protein)
VAILAAGILIMMVLLGMKEDPPQRPARQRPKIVTTEVVTLGPVAPEITAYGRVTSARPVELYAEAAGTLERGEVPFRPAQAFERGDLLYKIDDRQARLDLNAKKSELLTALASVLPEIRVDFPDEYRAWQEYFDTLDFESRLAPLPQTNNRKVKLFLSRFNVYRLYFAARNLEIALDKHFYYAPFDGSIVVADLREGSSVRVGTRLGQIVSLEELEVEVPLATADVSRIDFDAPVIFKSDELIGEWSGRVRRVGANVDERTQTVPVYIGIAPGSGSPLVNGVFLHAHIPGAVVDSAVAVPRRALYEDGFVYIVQNGALDYRSVSIARGGPDYVVVDKGLHTGDTLVTDALQGVASGMPAQPRAAAVSGRTGSER